MGRNGKERKKEYRLGDMMLRYLTDEEGRMALMLYPASCPVPSGISKKSAPDPMIQVKYVGDPYKGCYAPGNSLRNSESTMRLRAVEQNLIEEAGEKRIETILEDDRGYRAVHEVIREERASYLRCRCRIENRSASPVMLELLSSFSLTGISPYLEGDCSGNITVHRIQSRWSEEGRLLSQTLEDLQLEPGWNMDSVRCERFGQIGSMPVNHYFPYLAVEDTENHIFWGASLACLSSWQMEIWRIDENIAISGGLADREFGHWMKKLEPGEMIEAPEAILSVAQTGSIDEFSQRLVQAGKRSVESGPEAEQSLPIVFNEYCTTWGNPSHDNIREILEAIRGKGFTYFVIDCGWYKADGVPWDVSMGDYIPSRTLFPEGLEKTTQMIREEGLLPGIWFEIETVGEACDAYHQEEHLLHRDGAVLTTSRRRFWDMTSPWVREYLRERVTGLLKRCCFSYMKIDYNDTIGIGCDGCESLGEGLRRNMLGSMEFLEEVKREIPGIVLENCASGGHRLEPGFMGACSMASFSDAHECPEIPVIAANLHRVILPSQSQIWAVLRKDDSLRRIAYSIANTFLGRMCISGDVTELSKKQWEMVDRGIAFYKRIAPVIRDGRSYILSPAVPRMRHPEGWQAVVRIGENQEAYIVLHTFGGIVGEDIPSRIQLRLPPGTPDCIVDQYSDSEEDVEIRDGVLFWKPKTLWKATAIHLAARP